MDAGPIKHSWRPEGCDRVALVLQGGGALGAYQGGVYEALEAANLEPDWVAGVSIGAINGAIIAGNPPGKRTERLREFWRIVTENPLPQLGCSPLSFTPNFGGTAALKAFGALSYGLTAAFGVPRFFRPNFPGPFVAPPGAPGATSYYDTAPLRDLLTSLIDFDLLNSGAVRYAAGAVRVDTGNFVYFDNMRTIIRPEHVMASGALPPGFPMIEIDGLHYWDGGVVSNTPLQHLLYNSDDANMLVFQVDLFNARGKLPLDMSEVMSRQKDIQYSSRTRLVTDTYLRLHKQNEKMRKLLERIPDDQLDEAERIEKLRLVTLPEIAILLLIYQQAPYEGSGKDADFSPSARVRHWQAGRVDTERTLAQKDWLQMPKGRGVVLRDIHRRG
jgi:NTE family protein